MSTHRRAVVVQTLAVFVLILAAPLGRAALAQEVVGTKNGKVYHTHPDRCQGAQEIMPENLVKWPSAEDAVREGRRLCRMCLKLDSPTAGRPQPRNKAAADRPVLRRTATPASQRAGEEPASPGDPSGRVKDVLTGGTLLLRSGEKLRLLGVTCPLAGQPMADEAMRLIREETRGAELRLTWDSGSETTARRDDCGRLIVYVFVPGRKKDLGEELLAQGAAWCDRAQRCEREAVYAKRQEEAWWAGRGVWKRLEDTAGRVEVVTGKYATHYHPRGCRHIEHLIDPVTITVNEAKGRQLSPCESYFEKKERKPAGGRG